MPKITFKPTTSRRNFNLPAKYRGRDGKMIESPIKQYRSPAPGTPAQLLPVPYNWNGRMEVTLDTDDPAQHDEIKYLLNCPHCADSPLLADGYDTKTKPFYFVYDAEKIATGRVSKVAEKQKARDLVRKSVGSVGEDGVEVIDRGLLCALAFICGCADTKSDVMMFDAIYTTIDREADKENPKSGAQKVMDALHDKVTAFEVKIQEMLNLGVITKDKGMLYKFVPEASQPPVNIGNHKTLLAKLQGKKDDDIALQQVLYSMLEQARPE